LINHSIHEITSAISRNGGVIKSGHKHCNIRAINTVNTVNLTQIRQKNNSVLFNQEYSLIQGYAEQYQRS